MRSIQLEVNGQSRTISVRETELLLDALRDHLGLCSVRESCGVGQCGACTVLIDGRPLSSCLLLAALQDGKQVLTLEGLQQSVQSDVDGLHPIQTAFLEHEACQCGYCTPGFMMAASALLTENPAPTLEEVKEYLAGNLCRCGAYPEIFDATLDAAGRLRANRNGDLRP